MRGVKKLKLKNTSLKGRICANHHMNNLNNPFVPKGTLLDLQERRRKQFKIAVFCALSVGVVGLTTMLGVQGCKRENPANQFENSAGNEFAANTNLAFNIDTNSLPPVAASNTVASYNPPVETNTLPTNPPPVELPPVNTGGSEYKIQKGDTLAVIAKKNGVGWKTILAANPKLDPKRLKVGTTITIPAATAKSVSPGSAAADGTTYTVKHGDNLGKIARANHTTVKAIKAANNLKTERINVGQKLVIPAKAEAAPAAPAVAPMPEPVVAPPTAPAIAPVPPTTAPAK